MLPFLGHTMSIFSIAHFYFFKDDGIAGNGPQPVANRGQPPMFFLNINSKQ